MANLIVCCDGTWNTPNQEDNGQPSPTNVFKLHGALADEDDQGVAQTAYYRNGVGTSGSKVRRVLGGAFGAGLSNDIKSAYKWLCDHYDPATSRIYLFGFSRGAFSVRSLAGLIGRCGIVIHNAADTDVKRWENVDTIFDIYRGPKHEAPARLAAFDRHDEVKIAFLGVWDTVGALGIPHGSLLRSLKRLSRYRFHDTVLGDNVECARHAVSIDEQRQAFTPTLWENPPSDRVVQVWFPGVHGDVGGSYARRGLGDAALKWMIDEAKKAGLAFKASALAQISPNYRGVLHNSVQGFFAKLRTRPRSVPHFTSDDIHKTAKLRHANPPLAQPKYWPTKTLEPGERDGVDVFARPHWNAVGLYLEAGETYRFRAKGEWLDAKIRCTAEGPVDKIGFGQIVQKAALLPEMFQRRRRSRDGKEGGFVAGSRREHDFPFFCLIGVIANGDGVNEKTQIIHPHETFKIGASRAYTPTKSGFLYCYANDVWSFYGNNKGSIRLDIIREA